MVIAILIFSYLLWIGDLIDCSNNEGSNLFISTALIILLSWQYDRTWGVVMLCVAAPLALLLAIKSK